MSVKEGSTFKPVEFEVVEVVQKGGSWKYRLRRYGATEGHYIGSANIDWFDDNHLTIVDPTRQT